MICNSHPEPYELQVWKAFRHMQLVSSWSFIKLLWPFERITSYAHDQDHVHIQSHAILLHLEGSKYIFHPSTNKTPCYTITISLQSCYQNVWAIQKRNKRCIPREGMPHAHKACQKKREENIVHTKNITREREFIWRSFIHHPPKISTHLHILIKVYDLFLL